MEPQMVLSGLEEVAERVGLEVRYERLREDDFELRSGRCRLMGKEILFIDRALGMSDRIEVLVRELKQMNLTGIYMKPYFRALLQVSDGEDPED